MLGVLASYRLEIEALLTWFPTRSTAALREARMRGDTIKASTIEPVFQVGNRRIHTIGQGGTASGADALAPNNAVVAFIDIGLDNDETFEVYCELHVGRRRPVGKKRLHLAPGVTIPFMINMEALANDDEVAGTSAVLQGVMTTTRPLGVAFPAAVTDVPIGG
ncbi:MAG: hypothetical protein AB7F35_20260 [Acetobacteraceae bacterium]